MTDQSTIHPAATVILLRDMEGTPHVLMGQRGAKAAFMPNKFVFPGGRMDAADATVPLTQPIATACAQRLEHDTDHTANAFTATAVRELWEETGQILGDVAPWHNPSPDWECFAKMGYRPSAAALTYVFRALTPPGRSRRFDARFFLADADALRTDPDDFSAACDELSHISWVTLDQARALDLPFITRVVLSQVANLTRQNPPQTVPFFDNTTSEGRILQIA